MTQFVPRVGRMLPVAFKHLIKAHVFGGLNLLFAIVNRMRSLSPV